KINASELAVITGGTLSGDHSVAVAGILTDSRSSGSGHDLLFVALRGPNHDGHRFIEQLYGRGVRLFLIDTLPQNHEIMTGAAFVKVDDTLEALHLLAARKRDDFRGKIIAVTGSAGKTIVKEWLAETIGTVKSVIRSPRSYNSQLGVALSLLNLDDRYDVAVIEAGISRPGEMKRLARIIRPDTVIITNAGDAHGENFSGREEIAAEKLLLAAGAGLIVYCADDRIIKGEVGKKYSHLPAFTWSLSGSEASLSVSVCEQSGEGQVLQCTTARSSFSAVVPFADRASAENAISVISCCIAEGIPEDIIIKSVESLPAVAMRMEVKKGINGCTLIEDYYNSDPGSLVMALDFLRTHARGKTALILSDFRQIGGDESRLYEGVSEAVRRTGIDRFIGVGEALCRQRHLFPEGSSFYGSTADFAEAFRSFAFRDETLLIKGARAFGFERISSLLVQQLHQTRLEINMNAVVHNLNEFRHLLKPGTGIMAMVKAFAYGSGSAEIASLLEYHRVTCFAVAYADEGVALREAGITAPVMVMNPDESAMEMIIRHNLEPEIYSMESYESFLRSAKRYGLINYPVHLKMDTGMHRLGFSAEEINRLAEMLPSEQHVRIISLFSHLSASENPLYDDFTHRQASLLTEAAKRLGESLGYRIRLHLLNSAGISRFPDYQFDMVRIGIGLYGIGDYRGVTLRHTTRFLTAVSQVRAVPAGEPVSYGCNGAADSDREIAVIPVGYADGLRRELGNGRGSLFIRGRRVPIAGSICMDMCMVDVTGMDVRTGDEAEIFGNNIPVEEIAQKCNTIPYEILTSIPVRVKRVYVNE
ncbi:MAG: bifunctional UDP-N-acetylmuramoyl-tripeptide:D-alanyl-D-alanine ligase/alanine racemase, partial [Bacteroidales bacterium]|nr:bifunctional UDP-N-acetylmuramoyl-tripeptide:D-alanyl-D-alanine ligase/alanine racemase [Bacteroidales bacterium]